MLVLDSPFIEEDYRLSNITLGPIGAEQKVKLGEQLVNNITKITHSNTQQIVIRGIPDICT